MSPSSDHAAPDPAGRRSTRLVLGAGYARAVRGFERHAWLFDSLFKAGPLVFIAVMIYPVGQTEGPFLGAASFLPWPPRFALELLAILPLAFSRLRPGTAAGIIAFSCLCQLLTGLGPGISAVSVPLVVYACATYGSRRASLGSLAAALAGAGLLGIFVIVMPLLPFLQFPQYPPNLSRFLFMGLLFGGFAAAVVLVAWLFGDMAGRRRRELTAITERNELLERERDHEARLAADAERMRIAREMHDVVSHSMSVMIAQSDGGRYVVGQDPDRAAQVFETIGGTGREALTELRRMLGVLREEGVDQRRPTPGLQDLPRLLEDVRASGLEVQAYALRSAALRPTVFRPATGKTARGKTAPAQSVDAVDRGARSQDRASAGDSSGSLEDFTAAVRGFPALPEGVGLAVYRIVQEALTNTLKHAGPQARATVWLGIVDDDGGRTLTVEIQDTGLGARADSDGGGSGLRGMRERATLYGGEVEVRGHESGFDVLTRFPISWPEEVQHREAQPDNVPSGEAQPEDASSGEAQPGEAQPGEVPPEEVQHREAQHREAQPGEVPPGEAQPEDASPGEGRPREARDAETQPPGVDATMEPEVRQRMIRQGENT